MKIKTINLKHFRRFTDLTISLGDEPKKIIALVGPNGCGKSSVFDAFLEKLKNYHNIGGGGTPAYFGKSQYSPEVEKVIYERNNAITIEKSDGTSDFSSQSFYVRTPYRFSGSITVNQINKLENIFQEPRPEFTAAIDNRLNQNYQRLHGQLIHEYYEGEKTGKQFREEIIGSINTILSAILDIQITDLGDIIGGKGQLYFSKGTSSGFPYENLSSGEKEVIDIVVDLIVKTKDYSDTVFCIDEPELHLNTSIQRKLLIEIEKIIPDTCQLWIATHSVGFLRALQEELKDKTSVLNFGGKDFDIAQVIVPMTPNRKEWQKIFQTALEDLTGLVAPKTIIYCEGRKDLGADGEEQGLDANVYNQIFGFSYPDALFISSGGNTEPDKYAGIALTVLSKAFSGCEILLLKDRDIMPDGSPTTSDDRVKWIGSNKQRRMLERKEIENYLFDFEVINVAYPEVLKDDYDKIFNEVIDEDYKCKTGDLMKLCGEHTGISAMDFKLKLSEHIVPTTIVFQELNKCIFNRG